MLLSFKLPSFFGWGQEVRLIRYSMWWNLHSCWNKCKPFRTLWRDAKFQGLGCGTVVRHANMVSLVFWVIILKVAEKMAFVLSFSVPFLIWLWFLFLPVMLTVSILAKWIQGVSDPTFMCAAGKTGKFQIIILAHFSPLMYRAFEFCAPEVYVKAVLQNILVKSCNVNDLKYWVNYMVGLPAVEWFALCHVVGQLQKYSVVLLSCEEFPN